MEHNLNSIIQQSPKEDIFYTRNKSLIDKLEREYWENEKLKDKWILQNEIGKHTEKSK